jgi:hypothetical protein
MDVSRQLHAPAALPAWDIARGIPEIGWVDPRGGLDAKKRNVSCLCRVSNLGSSVAIPTETEVKSSCLTVERIKEVDLGRRVGMCVHSISDPCWMDILTRTGE